MMRRAVLPILLVLVPLFAGCNAASRYDPEWVGQEVKAPSDRVLWECTVIAFEKQGFPVGAGFDPATRTATSGWRNDLSPFRGMGDGRQGFREQATIRFRPAGPQTYRIDVRVQRQVNNDIARPLDLSYADWKDAPDDTQEALLLLQLIRSQVGDFSEFQPSSPR